MKKIILSTLIFTVLSCKAQSPVIDLNSNSKYADVNGAYYKDIGNFQNQYEGTWLYTNGANTLKIVLQKKIMHYVGVGPKTYYTDYVIGEYQYNENGLQIVNTLNNLSIIHPFIFDYNLAGNAQMPNDIFPKCTECIAGEKRLLLYFNEPSRRDVNGLQAKMIARKFTENGVEKLKIWFVMSNSSFGYLKNGQSTTIESHSIPYGEYILIKQ